MSQKLTVPNTRFHKITNLLSFLLLIGIFAYAAVKWPDLPETIATHFNFMGEADGWGSKGSIWFIPIMSLFLYLLLTLVSRFPSVWNVPGPVTPYNKNWVYRNTKNLLVFLKFLILLDFFYINYCAIGERGLGWFYTIFYLVSIFGSMAYFIIRCKRVPPLEEEPKEFDGF